MMQPDCDILIAGGGLAGGCLALALHNTDLRVTVVEVVSDAQRASSPAGDRALALAHGTVRILDRLGLWSGIEQHATPIRHIHVSERGRYGKTRLSAKRESVDALGWVVTARTLETHVAQALANASIELLCPARIIALTSGTDAAHVGIQADNVPINRSARLVVGADGGNSSIRRLLEIGQTIHDYDQTAIVTLVKPQRNPAGTAYERFTTSGPLAFLPTDGGRCSVIWTQESERAEALMALPDAEFLRCLQECFGYRLGRLSLCGPRRRFPLTLVQAERMTAQRTALVGNAVHQLHPVAGQGFNLGLRDVDRLAELLIAAAADQRDPGCEQLLAAYERARRTDHAAVIGFTDRVVRLFSNDWWALAAARSAGLVLLDHIPPLKHGLARYAMGLGVRGPTP